MKPVPRVLSGYDNKWITFSFSSFLYFHINLYLSFWQVGSLGLKFTAFTIYSLVVRHRFLSIMEFLSISSYVTGHQNPFLTESFYYYSHQEQGLQRCALRFGPHIISLHILNLIIFCVFVGFWISIKSFFSIFFLVF
jgi:hypothetical protein